MPNEIDLSTEALLAHRAKAEAATPGPWEYFHCDGVCIGPQKRNDIFFETPQELSTELSRQEQEVLAAHIVANDPQTVMAHVDEILRLRNDLAATECREGEGDAYVEQLCLERDDLEAQVETLKLEAMRLEREADWLADRCREFCQAQSMCLFCPTSNEPLKVLPRKQRCGVTIQNRFEENFIQNWREAARKAVEKNA